MTLLLLLAPHGGVIAPLPPDTGASSAPPRRLFAYHVFSSLAGAGLTGGTETMVGTWPEAAAPSFSVSLDNGAEALTVTLPRRYASLGEALDAMGDATMQLAYRVDVYAISRFSLARTMADASAAGVLVFRGTIEEIRAVEDGNGWKLEVDLHSLARVAAQTAFATTAIVSGDPATVAHTFWLNNPSGIGWDARNATSTGVSLGVKALSNTTLLDALRTIMHGAGPQWHVFITPQGFIRLIDDTETTTSPHELTAGVHAVNVRVSKLAIQARRVLTATDTGLALGKSVVSSPSTRQDTNDPREVWESLPEKVPAAWAQVYANARVRQLNHSTVTATCTVLAARYDVDQIAVGDRVHLQVAHAQRTDLDATDPNDLVLRVARLRYAADAVDLELTFPVADWYSLTQYANPWMQRMLRGFLSA